MMMIPKNNPRGASSTPNISILLNLITMINKIIAIIPSIGIIPGNPSLYSMKIKEANTKAEPVSFCMIMISIGSNMIEPIVTYDFNPSSLNVCRLITFANISAVINFANSAGCILNGPNGSQERDPLMSGAIKTVNINNKIINM